MVGLLQGSWRRLVRLSAGLSASCPTLPLFQEPTCKYCTRRWRSISALFYSLNFATTQWKVTNVHDCSYFIEWTVKEGPPFFFSFDGPGGPVRQDTPVLLLPNKQEWVIPRGEGEHVYWWMFFSRLFLSSAQSLTNGHQYWPCQSAAWCQFGY